MTGQRNIERLIHKLRTPGAEFTRTDVAVLMSVAQRWGYEVRADEDERPDPLSWSHGYATGYRARVAEENAAYPPPKIFTMGAWCDRVVAARNARTPGEA